MKTRNTLVDCHKSKNLQKASKKCFLGCLFGFKNSYWLFPASPLKSTKMISVTWYGVVHNLRLHFFTDFWPPTHQGARFTIFYVINVYKFSRFLNNNPPSNVNVNCKPPLCCHVYWLAFPFVSILQVNPNRLLHDLASILKKTWAKERLLTSQL